MYTHASLPQKSQLKWVAPAAATTMVKNADNSNQSFQQDHQQQQQQISTETMTTSMIAINENIQ